MIIREVPKEMLDALLKKAKEDREREVLLHLDKKSYNVKQVFDENKQIQILQANLIGETIFDEILKEKNIPFRRSNSMSSKFSHIIDDKKINVKVLRRNVEVLPHYFVELNHNVVNYSDVDIFVFASFNVVTNKITFVGSISKEDFFKKAKLMLKGTTRNGFVCRDDKYEMNIFDLPKENIWF